MILQHSGDPFEDWRKRQIAGVEPCCAITSWEGETIWCDRSGSHPGLEHYDRRRGLRWLQDGFKVLAWRGLPEVTHLCPPDGGGLMPCCGLTPFEVPRTDQMTLDPALVTCGKEGQQS